MILDIAAAASGAIRFDDLGVGPVALDLGFFTLKWYSLAYLAGILIGYWYLLKLIAQPGSPMGRRHADACALGQRRRVGGEHDPTAPGPTREDQGKLRRRRDVRQSASQTIDGPVRQVERDDPSHHRLPR